MKLAQSRVHFIGVGGIGMCGLAELLHNMGAQVSGSDIANNAQTLRLKDLGIKLRIGHASENIQDVDVVVYSSAVKLDNVELAEARKRKIPIIPRAEALAEVMRLKRGIAIAGTHGKTTTTSLTASIFITAQTDPTIVVGGRLDLIKSTALLGKGEWVIAEADESDGSFHRLSPETVIITNIDNDHMDYYKSFLNLQKAFFDFAQKIPFYGSAILCGDEDRVRSVFLDFPKRFHFYGFEAHNDYVLSGRGGQYTVHHHGQKLGDFKINVPGRHNALNALAAIIAGLHAGLSFQVCAKGIEAFQGVDRRLQFKGEKGGVRIYDDYGHHPTEVRAVLQAIREKYPNRRIVVVFQPHRYSRTQYCWHDFANCFNFADQLYLLDIYPAGEAPIVGIDSVSLAKSVQHPSCRYLGGVKADAVRTLEHDLQKDDVVLTLGAGDVWKIGEWYLNGLPQ